MTRPLGVIEAEIQRVRSGAVVIARGELTTSEWRLATLVADLLGGRLYWHDDAWLLLTPDRVERMIALRREQQDALAPTHSLPQVAA